MTAVHGSCDNRFKSVREALETNIESGEELGAATTPRCGCMMNKMAPGIIGSPRADAYLRAAYAALGVALSDPAVAAQPG